MRIIEDTEQILVVEETDWIAQKFGYSIAGVLVLIGIGRGFTSEVWPLETTGVLIILGIIIACWVFWYWDLETRLTIDQNQATFSLFTRSRRETRRREIQFESINRIYVHDPYGDSPRIEIEHDGHEPFALFCSPHGTTLESFADKLRDRVSRHVNFP